jgi:hypothetical protein
VKRADINALEAVPARDGKGRGAATAVLPGSQIAAKIVSPAECTAIGCKATDMRTADRNALKREPASNWNRLHGMHPEACLAVA